MPYDRAAALWNPDLAPTGPEQRNWAWYHFASLWIGMIVAVSGWMLAGGLAEQGMSARQAALTVLLGNVIVLVPMLLNAMPGRGTRRARLPARALVAWGWYGIQTRIGDEVWLLARRQCPGRQSGRRVAPSE